MSKLLSPKGLPLIASAILIMSLTFMMGISAEAQSGLQEEALIVPRPNQISFSASTFILPKKLRMVVSGPEQEKAAGFLGTWLARNTKTKAKTTTSSKGELVFTASDDLADEAYRLSIDEDQILVEASGYAGYFYAIQSLKQLIRNASAETTGRILLSGMKIEDAPRFAWRAYMLDEARYFQGEAFVKQQLDEMASLKMNVFHWHLTDDAGWRIEIKKYPKLTEVGAQRTDSEIGVWGSGKTSGEAHGGFYTQKQIKDIVQYALDRNITIVPEFEMPGHSSAAIAAYPWLGTAKEAIEVPVKFGRHYDNYDITDPKVITFIHEVLNELFALFPSEVIHIGGDEVGYKVWEDSEHVQQYMKKNQLASPADLQVSFTNQISQYIQQQGRRMMGWNEIMGINIHNDFEEKKHDEEAETELAKNVIVHFWKGNVELATRAAQKGYGIVNSLHSQTYLDYPYKSISLEKAYSFDPVPSDLDEKYHKNIYGLGCQMWTEWTPSTKDVERQTYPRIAAYAEVGWTELDQKDFESFQKALKKVKEGWLEKGIIVGGLSAKD